MDDPNRSPFVDDWTDEGYRRRYTFHARENYEQMKEMRLASQRGHLEYGKWLIASMLAIHGGAIYAISGLRSDLPRDCLTYLVNAAVWHITGICFIVVAGFLAWLNFQCAEQIYFRRANPAVVYRTDADTDEVCSKRDPVTATLYGAAVFGILSGWSFVAGASEVFRALRLAVG